MRYHTILDALKEHAWKKEQRLCMADKAKAVTYGQFYDAVLRGAAYLAANHLKQGEIVAIQSSQTIECVAALFAVQSAGGTACLLEKNVSGKRRMDILQQLHCHYLIVGKITKLEHVCCLDLQQLYTYPQKIKAPYFAEIADILFTTGTTGKPKGIMVSHEADVAIAENVIDSVQMIEEEVELITSPCSHSLALRRIYAAIYLGSAVILTENVLLHDNFYRLLEQYQVTAITLVPAVLNLLLEATGDQIRKYAKQLHYIQLGSAPLAEEMKRRLVRLLPGVRLYNTYGATESGCTVIFEFSRYLDKKGCIGRTTVHAGIRFVDADGNVTDARDEKTAGFLAFQGAMNMSGYLYDQDLTKTVLRDGIVYTNDIGYRGNDQMIYFIGRAGEVINCGGYKISPSEIEETAKQFPGIADCACVPMTDRRVGEVPKLLIQLERNALDEKEFRKWMRSNLEEYKVPKAIGYIEKIPRTFNGKIQRRRLGI